MFVHSLCGNVHGADVSEKSVINSPDYYRARAAEMLKLAEEATTDEARNTYLQLASNWNSLASKLKNPSW